MNSMGDRIRALRLTSNMSQRMFGELAGISDVAVCDLEKNKRDARCKTLIAICKRYNVSADFLLFGKVQPEIIPLYTRAVKP